MKSVISFIIAASVGTVSIGSLSAQAANYWQVNYQNSRNHFYDGSHTNIKNWLISSSDRYISGSFLFSHNRDYLLGIKAGQANIMAEHTPNSAYHEWFAIEDDVSVGNTIFSGLWISRSDDLYVAGDFTGSFSDDILLANPNGNYMTIHGGYPNSGNFYPWKLLHHANNGNIDATDTLLSGDFNGDGVDEVLLIKQNQSFTMRFNQQTPNWDIINTTGPLIHWWTINPDDDYVVGDFDGDGSDELIAINPNGWSHTMRFTNNQWQYFSGVSNSFLGHWNITSPDTTYIAADFDRDGKDELIAINRHNGWSRTLGMTTGQYPQWFSLKDNAGDGHLAPNVPIDSNDIYLEYLDNLLVLNPNGFVRLLKY